MDSSEDVFRAKRGEIPRGFLERPALYCTPAFVDRFEAAARANLAGGVKHLG